MGRSDFDLIKILFKIKNQEFILIISYIIFIFL